MSWPGVARENPIIEGDKLEVLKLLQKSYLGKVKMICIDPPYNTGQKWQSVGCLCNIPHSVQFRTNPMQNFLLCTIISRQAINLFSQYSENRVEEVWHAGCWTSFMGENNALATTYTRVGSAAWAAPQAIQEPATTALGGRMALPLLIRYVLLVATRQSTVNISLSALAVVLLLSVGLLLNKVAGDPVPLAVIQCAEGKRCESGQNEEQGPEKEQKESPSRVQDQGSIEPVNDKQTLLALAKQFQEHPTQIAEWKQQLLERVADVFDGVAP
jgi:hypothetical protein